MGILQNKTVIITGASGGLGKAIACALVSEECNIVLAARREEKLLEVQSELLRKNKACSVLIHKTDVSQEVSVQDLFLKASLVFGSIDVVINNAGKGLPAKVVDTSKKDWDSIVATNLTGVFLCSKEALIYFSKNNKGTGHIVTVCSIAGLFGAPGYGAYCASKHAVTGFKRSVWLETFKDNIKVSTIYPARLKTDFFERYETKPSDRQMLSTKYVAKYVVAIIKRQRLKQAYLRFFILLQRLYNLI